MLRTVLVIGLALLINLSVCGQDFEVRGIQESYKGYIGEVLRAPLHIKNNSERTLMLVVRKANSQLGSTQKSFFCLGENCLNEYTDEYLLKLEPGQSVNNLSIGLETGLVSGISSTKYIIYARSNPLDATTVDLNYSVEEKPEKSNIYTSPVITIYDVYPNPVVENAYIQYQILNEKIKASIVIHNILGNPLGEYELSKHETRLKMRTEDFNAGIYFYTLYVDNEGVMTRKLIIKK